MKTKKYYYLTAFILIGLAVFATWKTQAKGKKNNGKAIQLSISTSKETFSLGEIVEIDFETLNMNDASIKLQPPDVRNGNLQLFISNDGVNYRKYEGPNWGNLDSRMENVSLESGKSLQTKASVLYNQVFPTEHLTEMYAERIRKEKLDTVFAISEAGSYWLKAVYTNNREKFQSQPLLINVEKPLGADQEIWEKIKNKGEYAYFLQTANILYPPETEERRQFVESLQQISGDNPNSALTQRVSVNLSKFNANQESIRDLLIERQNKK